jgi:hypothetical protein
VKFLTNLGKSASEAYNLLMEVYGDEPILALEKTHFTKKKKKKNAIESPILKQ